MINTLKIFFLIRPKKEQYNSNIQKFYINIVFKKIKKTIPSTNRNDNKAITHKKSMYFDSISLSDFFIV